MIGVTGGTGNVGAELTRLLAARGSEFRVLAHRPETVPSPLGAGVVVPLDYGDPSTWAPALDGVRRLFLLFPLPRPRTAKRWMEPFVGAAADAGVEHVVYLTVPGADRIKRIPHHRVERAIERSGMSWTFLRCAYFMQNMHRRISTHGLDVVERDEVFVPAKRGLTTFLDARDAAEVALRALDDPEAHARLAHVLAGPETVGFDAMAAALGSALGREIRYAAPSLPAFWRRLRQHGVTWDVIFFMTIVYSLARRGRNVVRESETERLLGRRPTDLRAWAEASAWRFEEEAWT